MLRGREGMACRFHLQIHLSTCGEDTILNRCQNLDDLIGWMNVRWYHVSVVKIVLVTHVLSAISMWAAISKWMFGCGRRPTLEENWLENAWRDHRLYAFPLVSCYFLVDGSISL